MTIRGDMYIQDMANTKGHVAAITDGKWHPRDSQYFVTSSLDGSVRIWDLTSKLVGVDQQLMHVTLIKAHTNKGIKLPVCSINYSRTGNLIAAGCTDGSLQIWDVKTKSYYRPQFFIKDAHQPGEITCVKFMKDEKRIATRSMDDTLKLWDIRNTQHPIHEWKDLTNLSSKTNIAFSPDEKMILTGTSVRKGFANGMMMGFDT